VSILLRFLLSVGFFLGETLEFELRALHLQGRYGTTGAKPLALLALGIFVIGSCFMPELA
jgi:hypothetical protein